MLKNWLGGKKHPLKKRVLVIDDDYNVRTLICENLADCGYEVQYACNGEDGLEMLKSGKPLPDLVITDIIMPFRDGMEVILDIRQKYPDIKLLSISGGGRMNSRDYLAMSWRLGAHAILRKPIDMRELERTVERLTH